MCTSGNFNFVCEVILILMNFYSGARRSMASCSNVTKEAQNKRRMGKNEKTHPPSCAEGLSGWKEEGRGPFFLLTLARHKGGLGMGA